MPKTKQFDPEQALDRAMHLFWEKGYAATSMQDLVDHMGLSRSSMYDTFVDKQTLFHQALQRYLAQNGGLYAEIERVIAAGEAVKPFLRRFFQTLAAEARTVPGNRGCFAANATAEKEQLPPPTQAILLQHKDAFTAALTRLLTYGQARGEIAAGQRPEALAAYLYMFMNGMRLVSRLDAAPDFLDPAVEAALSGL